MMALTSEGTTGMGLKQYYSLVIAILTAIVWSAAIATPASAATTYTRVALSQTQNGSTVNFSTTVKASTATTVRFFGIRLYDAAGNDLGEITGQRPATITTTGTTISGPRDLKPGSYQMAAYLNLPNDTWPIIGGLVPFTVSTPMPVGNIPGWRQTFAEDFSTRVPLGSWPGGYGAKFDDYTGAPDTSKQGYWNTKAITSATNGQLDFYLHNQNGVPQAAAIVPKTSQLYGRYSVRFKVDPGMDGWASAWLLWPDTDNWNEGEVDFPEGELTGAINAYTHTLNNPQNNAYALTTPTPFAGAWHTATTEWKKSGLKFFLDGAQVGSTIKGVPKTSMHWVLQSETAYGNRPTDADAGHVKIDWLTIYAPAV